MHKVTAKGILSAQNGMNIYRGCTHGCIYCDARSTCYQMNHAFEDITVKINAPELLEQALRKKRKKCMIGTGAMSDPYLHAEKELRLTRRCLELIDRYGFGLAIQTKSDMILRDLDLLTSINRKTKCVVQMTPILPFINDTEENIWSLLQECWKAGVYGILTFGIGLTLRDGDRQYFYEKLDRHFPGMKERYIRRYGNAYELPVPDHVGLMELVRRECEKAGMEWRKDRLFEYMNRFEDKQCGKQMTLDIFK